MNAIRQYIDVHDNSFNVVLPKDFKAKRLEIIILPSDNEDEDFQNHKIQLSEETKKMLDERLADYEANIDNLTDFDEFLKQLENED